LAAVDSGAADSGADLPAAAELAAKALILALKLKQNLDGRFCFNYA